MNMNNPLISIIIPAYNVEKYISGCLKSVTEQSYTNLEIIVMNDGSTDQTSSICREYRKIDERIVLIEQNNQGLSAARNNALDIMNGEYVAFVDGDDQVAPHMYETLLYDLFNNQADIAMCNFLCIDKTGERGYPSINYNIPEKLVLEGNTKIEKIIFHNNMFVCNKLYRRYLFDEVRFPVGRVYEDAFVMPHIVHVAKKLVTNPECLYYYVSREDSITHVPFSADRFNMFYAQKSVYDYITHLSDIDLPYEKLCRKRMFLAFLYCVEAAIDSRGDYSEYLENMIREIKKYDILDCGLGGELERMAEHIITDIRKYTILHNYIKSLKVNLN